LQSRLPAEPVFGAPLPIQPASQPVLDFLALRRSASAGVLAAPAPSHDELRDLLRLAARAPDHGKLNPWRFLVLEGEAKAALVAGLEAVAAGREDGERLAAALFKMRTPPMAVAVISRPVVGKIPEWEQVLSAGAVCMTLTIAAQAMGYGANWITDWYAYDAEAVALLGLQAGERVAGFVFLGTPTEPPAERVRPDIDAITAWWTP
jgi:nitroreductase